MNKKQILVGTLALGMVVGSLQSCQKKAVDGNATEKSADAKCGEGKCGEGKCGGSDSTEEADAAANVTDSTAAVTNEAKCGDSN